MGARLWAAVVLVMAAAAPSTSSSSLLGEHVCQRKEAYNVTMKVRSKEPVTLRTYEWCMKVPPRCSRYHTELREVDRTQTVTRDRVVEECCAGFQRQLDRCVPAPGSSQPPPAPATTDAAVVPADPAVVGSPYWEQLRLTDAPAAPPPHFSASAELSAQQKGPPPAAAFPKKDTRLDKKGAPDKTAGVDKEKPPVVEVGHAPPATEPPEAQTSTQPPSPPPLPPELDLPPPLDMPPVPAMSDHNQSLTVGAEPQGPGRSGRRRMPPEQGHPVLHAELPPLHWEERAEPGAVVHVEGAEHHEQLTTLAPTQHAEPPSSVSKEAVSKAAPRKKASDVKEVPAYARKTATPPPTGVPPPPAAGAEGAEAAGGGPEEGAWEPWGWQPGAAASDVTIEHRVLNGRRKAAHAKRGRGEDLKSLPPGKDPGVGLLVMPDHPAVAAEAPPPQDATPADAAMPAWLPVAIGATALVVIVAVSVSAAMLARGRRRYVAGAAGGGPGAAGGGAPMELRPITPHGDPMAPNTTVAAPVFLSPVFMQAAGAEAAAPDARPGGGVGGGGGQGLLLAAVLSPSHALCSPRASSFIDSLQAATYDVPPSTLRRDATLVGGLQLHHMCSTPPPQGMPPQHVHHQQSPEPPQHVYEELPACWQRPLPACH